MASKRHVEVVSALSTVNAVSLKSDHRHKNQRGFPSLKYSTVLWSWSRPLDKKGLSFTGGSQPGGTVRTGQREDDIRVHWTPGGELQ